MNWEDALRIGPAPLMPAFPIRPERQETYPRALGQAFVGTARLDLPEVKARVAAVEVPRKAPDPQPEILPAKAEARPQVWFGPASKEQGPGISRPLLGSLFDGEA